MSLLREARASEDQRPRVKREREDDDVEAVMDCVQSEHSVYETDALYMEEHLQIGPTMLRPLQPPVAKLKSPEVKLEPLYLEVKLEPEYPEVKLEPVDSEIKLEPHYPEVKLEPRSPERETSQEDLTSVYPSPATAVPPAGRKQNKESRKRKRIYREPVICDICKGEFYNLSALNRHMRVHTGEKPFSCTMCSAKFTQSCSLKTHIMHNHTGEKPFHCTTCQAKYARSHSLKRHMRAHTGEKPFSCTMCSAKFTHSSSLKTHMHVHTGEKPFSCTTCNAKFTQSHNLKTHMFLHTGEKPKKRTG